MAPTCQITFENQSLGGEIFWCGETLRCNIVLNLAKPRMMKGVYVTISGWANCNWSVRDTYGNITVTTNYTGQQGYIDSVTYLVGSETSDVSELPAGIHTYSFVYDIPPNLPSSIEGNKGHIRYDVRVTINRPFPLLDDKFKQDLILIKPFDLNSQIDLLGTPLQNEIEHSFRCYSCKSGPLHVVASVPQTGYIPGQYLKVNIEVTNDSDVTINSIKSSLCQFIEYFSDVPEGGKWIDLKKVAVSLVDGISKNETKCYDLAILIPSVPPTDETSSKTIHVTYCVKIKFNTNWFHQSPSMLIPITIGTVALGQCSPPIPKTATAVEEDIYDSPALYIRKQSDNYPKLPDPTDEIFKI